MILLDKRTKRLQDVAAKRQYDLCVVLENVHDPHNIGAVLRSCDSVGIQEVYLIVTDQRIIEKSDIGKNSASGARKWLDVHIFHNVEECMAVIKSKYDKIYATHLGLESKSLYDLDLTQSVALMFGNEHSGLTKEALNYVDGNFIIPQYGMTQSLNISVACAVSAYEALRQREKKGNYELEYSENHPSQSELYSKFEVIHKSRYGH